MRLGLLLLVILGTACIGETRAISAEPGDDGAVDPSAPRACDRDDDCVAVGATCCECPTFAVAVDDPIHRSCSGVTCPGQQCAENVRATCDSGVCVLACAPMACDGVVCPDGFALDTNGCLSCECAAPVAGGCSADIDCTQTRADCCGCEQGGSDTAVLGSELAGYDASLGCPDSPQCPSVNTCTSGEAPQCVQGRCELLQESLPPDACGIPELPACPPGLVCTVNTNDPANMQGLGVCTAP